MARSPRQKRLCELLIAQRHKAGLTQAEVAKKLRRHQPFIANIESGQRRVDVIELMAIGEVIGLDVGKIIRELKKLPG